MMGWSRPLLRKTENGGRLWRQKAGRPPPKQGAAAQGEKIYRGGLLRWRASVAAATALAGSGIPAMFLAAGQHGE